LIHDLQAKMDQLAIQLEEEKTLRSAESAKQNERFDRLESEFEAKIRLLMDQNVKQEHEIGQLKSRINDETISTGSNALGKDIFFNGHNSLKTIDSSTRTPPSSCRQLSTIGHYLDGIYLVANPDTNKIETIYCDFGSSTRTLIWN